MKINQLLAMCGIASALFLGVANVSAQQDNGGGRGGRGNFDPAQFQQRIMDNVKDQLGFTNDTDWNAVQPLVQKVLEAQRDARSGLNMRMMFGRNRDNNGGNNNRRGMFGGQPSPEEQALQTAVDNNAPADQIKSLLAKYQAAQQQKQAALKKAQDNLRAVLSVKQEAQATLMGLLD
jgi:hypothetical protein